MRKFLLELFFPKFCLGCQTEAAYLCQDCQALIDLADKPLVGPQFLSYLYFITDYQNFIIKRIIHKLKYPPFAKELSQTLTSLIIIYLENLEKKPGFYTAKQNYLIIPIPLFPKRLKWRGFNQAELIAQGLSEFLGIPILNNVLVKTKFTKPQADLSEEQRKQNVKHVFSCLNPETIKHKNILLIDDVYTTGATINEAARVLKTAGAKQINALVIARG